MKSNVLLEDRANEFSQTGLLVYNVFEKIRLLKNAFDVIDESEIILKIRREGRINSKDDLLISDEDASNLPKLL